MTQKKMPPHYENFDRTHCTQCALRGILEYFEPELQWDWEEIDRFTGKEPGKWTWQYLTQINMALRGYDVIAVNTEDPGIMLRDGVYETMVSQLGEEAANIQRQNSNLDSEQENMTKFQELVGNGTMQHWLRVPTIEDMKSLLEQGYLLDCSLNSRVLRDIEGYSSHMILVYDIDDEYVTYHESGPTNAGAGSKVSIEKFIRACTSPTPEQWAITAYKLKGSA